VLDDIEQNAETLDIEAAAARIRVPWLIIHGTEDESVRFNEAQVLAAASGSKKTRLLAVERGGHTFGATHPWGSSTTELDTVFDATLEWLAANLQ
jgi:pimeloyl-ACP methyl ester carboxylesterase